MTLGLFWSRYILELHDQHLREVDELYRYRISYEKWNWLVAKVPESAQIQILRGHNHGDDSWSCQKWLHHMVEWIRDNKPKVVYEAVADHIKVVQSKSIEELEHHAAMNLSQEELDMLHQAGYFKSVEKLKT